MLLDPVDAFPVFIVVGIGYDNCLQVDTSLKGGKKNRSYPRTLREPQYKLTHARPPERVILAGRFFGKTHLVDASHLFGYPSVRQ